METTPKDRHSNKTPFEHQPLAPHYICLVHLLPSPLLDSPIACDISIHHEDSCPAYETLSYTWGDLNDGTHDILLDGRRFTIRSNLCLFLKRLRRKVNMRIIWADAICIDQSNVEERNHQVQSMARIYQNAAQTLVWLGPGNQESDCVLEVIRKVDEIILLRLDYHEKERIVAAKREWKRKRERFSAIERYKFDNIYGVSNRNIEEEQRLLGTIEEEMMQLSNRHDGCTHSLIYALRSMGATLPPELSSMFFQISGSEPIYKLYPFSEVLREFLHSEVDDPLLLRPFSELCGRPYWRRVWIIQEIVLSAHIEIFCGSKTTTWDCWRQMLGFGRWSSMSEHARTVAASASMELYHEWEKRNNPLGQRLVGFNGLENILDKFNASICADIRDKIFGLLGLFENAPVEPDYAKTPIDLFSALMIGFKSELLHREVSRRPRRPISDLLRFGKLLQHALRLDIHGPEGGAKHGQHEVILEAPGTVVGRVLAVKTNAFDHGKAGDALINDWIHSTPVGPYTRSNNSQRVQWLRKVIERHSEESFGYVDYSQFLIELSDPCGTTQTITVSYFPGMQKGTPIKHKSPSVLTNTLCWFAHSRKSVGISDMHVKEGDVICNCSSIGPTHALILRESSSGLQVVGRAIVSPAPFKNGGSSYHEEETHGKNLVDGQRLEIAFDPISLLALVLLPFP